MVHNIDIWSSPTRDHAATNAIANNAIAGVNSIANQKGSHCWDAPEDDQLAASTVDALAAATSWRMASTQMMKVSARRSSGAKKNPYWRQWAWREAPPSIGPHPTNLGTCTFIG